jgi:Abortive infection C-terminus
LVDRVQKELRLHPTTVAPDQKGADAIIALLGSLANIANKIDEFRNLYGDGHGRSTKVAGLTSRHAMLVARCTGAYVGMILDTLTSPSAPWQKQRPAPASS